MAAKEKKLTVTKHLKDNQGEKDKPPEIQKGKRGRKPNSVTDVKLSPEQKTPPGRKKRKENVQDGRSTPVSKRARRSIVDQDESNFAAKTPPPSGHHKFKKAHLEKELGDLLENATGRNTPLLPRNKKINEKEEESVDSADEKSGGLYINKTRKNNNNEKDTDDENVSLKSFSTLLRTRKNVENKEVEDDVLSVRSVNLKSKKVEASEDDSSSIRSLLRPNIVSKPGRKKKCVLTAIAVKKKIFIRRGRPKKTKDIVEGKGKHMEEKRVGRIKVMDKNIGEPKQKRIIKKPLKFQSKMKNDQTRLRSSIALKNQKLEKAKLKLSDKLQVNKQKSDLDDVIVDQSSKERLKNEGQSVTYAKSDTSVLSDADCEVSKKKKSGMRKRKMRSDGRNEDINSENSDKTSDIYFFSDAEGANAQESVGKNKSGKILRHVHQQKGKVGSKKNLNARKQRRESGLHFETTRSPDDSSVMIVHPRFGPKIKGAKRLKPILPKTDEVNKQTKNAIAQDLMSANALSNSIATGNLNFNQLGNSYFVQSIPNFNLFTANSPIIRNYNSKTTAAAGKNFDGNLPGNNTDLPYSENGDYAIASYGSKIPPNEIIITPGGGIVLSGKGVVPSNAQNPSSVCFNGSNSNFAMEAPNGDIVYTSHESLNGVLEPGVIYQNNNKNLIQPLSCSNSNAAFYLKRPESMSTSLKSAVSDVSLSNPDISSNGNLKMNNSKTQSNCNTSTDIIVSEKALEGDCLVTAETSATSSLKGISKLDCIPSIPVAKNVNDLIMLKNKTILELRNVEREKESSRSNSLTNASSRHLKGVPNILRETNLTAGEKVKLEKFQKKSKKRILKNVRHVFGSSSDLTFSEPESSNGVEREDVKELYKTISCEQLKKSAQFVESSPKVLLQLGSEPITISDSLAPYETASMLLVTKKEKLEEKLDREEWDVLNRSPDVKGAVDVCRFSKENEEALKELGLDSDLEQTKSDMDAESPVKNAKNDELELNYVKSNSSKMGKKTVAGGDEANNVLKEMPVRKMTNCYGSGESFNTSPNNRIGVKSLLVLKNSDYLSVSPSKPPTVIDKLLEKNKSLKRAEQEGKSYNQNYRDLSENYEMMEVRPRKTFRELRTRKFIKGGGGDLRRGSHKKYIVEDQNCKIYGRRGSNPEMYSSNYLMVNSQISNENVPLRRITDPEGRKFQRRGSMDFDSIQKVLDRRCSLPTVSSDPTKLSRSLEDVNKLKTENVKTIVISSSKPLSSSKSKGMENHQPRVINIVTSNNGLKKGKNLMEEIGLGLNSTTDDDGGGGGGGYVNGDNKSGRRASVESSNSETENLQKLLDGLSDVNSEDKLSRRSQVPYYEGKRNSMREDKMRVSIERRKSLDEKEKKNVVIEESPEDLVTKETILSALGKFFLLFFFSPRLFIF